MKLIIGRLAEKEIAKIARLPKQKAPVFVVNARSMMRYVSQVEVGDTLYWADRVTGSRYHPQTGRCISGPSLRLDLASMED